MLGVSGLWSRSCTAALLGDTEEGIFFCTNTLWQFLLTEVTIGNDDILMEVNISNTSSIL